MKLTKKDLSLEKGLTKEWLITNGIGGYSSSTVLGANTRKYHGLLVAPLDPPAKRHVVLSKVDESITVGGNEEILYTNVGKTYISQGYQNLTSFQKKYVPTFSYQVGDIQITKTICMVYGKNTVCIQYEVKNGKQGMVLKLAPIINFRDFHSINKEQLSARQEIEGRKVTIQLEGKEEYPFYCYCGEGSYIQHEQDIFHNMYYIEEEKRGFDPEENHLVIGRYEIPVKAGQAKKISFIFSFEEQIEEIQVDKVIKEEEKRLQDIIKKSELLSTGKEKKEWLEEYIIAADQFIVYRDSTKLHTILAGYPWFLDWGRDSLIAFEGLLLKTKRYDLAKEILLMFIKDIKEGLVPNGYSEGENRPLYNSVDASLLLFEQVANYLKYTSDDLFVKDKLYPILVDIIDHYTKGIDLDDNQIGLEKDGLISCGTQKTQNTWMDAKVHGFAVTPRNGKPVEINSMWYNALKIAERLSIKHKEEEKAKKYQKMARKCQKSFVEQFYCKKKKCLYDVIGDDRIRPNQLFSLSLTYPVLDPSCEIANEIMETVTKKLLTPYGLKTLARGEKGYIEVYEGDGFKRDMSYHQGITWPWLLGLYERALKNRISCQTAKTKKKVYEKEYIEFLEKTSKIFEKQLTKEGCMGSIAELYDSKSPYLPKGAFAQAWSVAEIFRMIVEKQEGKIKE